MTAAGCVRAVAPHLRGDAGLDSVVTEAIPRSDVPVEEAAFDNSEVVIVPAHSHRDPPQELAAV